MGTTNTLKEWTIMLYLAGDNDLSDEMVWTLTELFRVTMPDEIAVTVQFDPLAKGSSTRLYRVQDTGHIDGTFRLEGKSRHEVNSASPRVLAEFIKQSAERNPAQNYALILSGHGGGIEGDFLTDYAANKNNLRRGSLAISDLATVFRRVRELCAEEKNPAKKEALNVLLSERKNKKMIDILGMDSCLMSMAEVACQVKADVKYLVGSEGLVKATGWPYYRLFEHLKTHASGDKLVGLDAINFAASLVHRCANYYADYHDADVSFDMSACDLDTVDRVVYAVQQFAQFATESMKQDKRISNLLVLAHWKAQSYKWELYTDIEDFFNTLQEACQSFKSIDGAIAELATYSKAVTEAVKAAVVCSRFTGPEFQYSHGLSIYFPWSEIDYSEKYEETAFAGATQWHEFLKQYFAATKRHTRERENQENPHDVPKGWGRFYFDLSPNGTQSNPEAAGQANQETGGATRTTPPHGRTTPPHGRMVDLLDLVGETRSRMKNQASTSDDYLVIPESELLALKGYAKGAGGS